MKFTPNNCPETIFIDSCFHICIFSLTYAEPWSIFVDKSFSNISPQSIRQHISQDTSQYSYTDNFPQIYLTKESTNQHQNILSRYHSSYYRKRLNSCSQKCNQIVPVTQYSYYAVHPFNKKSYPFWFKNTNIEQEKNETKKDDIESHHADMYYLFQNIFHRIITV